MAPGYLGLAQLDLSDDKTGLTYLVSLFRFMEVLQVGHEPILIRMTIRMLIDQISPNKLLDGIGESTQYGGPDYLWIQSNFFQHVIPSLPPGPTLSAPTRSEAGPHHAHRGRSGGEG